MDIAEIEYTDDSLFAGKLSCRQHKNGYRFSVDAILVAHYAKICTGDTILDLGTGSGVIPLILNYRYHDQIEVTGIEIQQKLAALAADNIASNGASRHISIINRDLRDIAEVIAAESFSSIICNPPFYKPDSGRLSQAAESANARHQLHGGIGQFLQAACYAVKNRGLVTFIYPAERLIELLVVAEQNRLEANRLRPIFSYPGHKKAVLVLVEFRKNGGRQLLFEEPLYIYAEKNGDYSAEVQAMYEP